MLAPQMHLDWFSHFAYAAAKTSSVFCGADDFLLILRLASTPLLTENLNTACFSVTVCAIMVDHVLV